MEQKTPGNIQDRFLELWEKSKVTKLTQEEADWMEKVQKEYWDTPDFPSIP